MRIPRAWKLVGLVKPWAVRRRTWSRLLGALDPAVGGPAAVVPGEDLVGPGDDGVDDVVELGQFSGLVEVTEPPERVECAVVVCGGVEAVELLQCLPARSEPGGARRRGPRGGPGPLR